MLRLKNPIQEYAWGSRTELAAFLGQPSPAALPQAELWLGAHPQASSSVLRDGTWQTLSSWIDADPETVLGARVHRAYGKRLPFLLKVLAAESPLSLQAHPSAAQARAGFEAEETAGVPINARHRNYKDPSHKPELLLALTSFEALCGFRRAAGTLRLLAILDVPEIRPLVADIRRHPDLTGLRSAVCAIMTAERRTQRALAEAVEAACQRLTDPGLEFAAEIDWARRLARLYPGDVGIVVALLLNLVRLRPGQAIFLSEGCLHAYLRGTGVEVMANSDNVLRGGLTSKHIDVPELLRVVDFRDGDVPVVGWDQRPLGERVLLTTAPEFELAVIDMSGSEIRFDDRLGPDVLLCGSGAVVARSAQGEIAVARGEAVFVTGSEGAYSVAGSGSLFRATVQSAETGGG